ncbi:ArsR family transcriptional regulator [Roseovarius faecimaris]|uniref:ArsR family transcriptional regulator n=1 Tax=Roseovarius faecimaris TaxID=2494550 RepID=A0A6I6IJD3_9RHOB|nr:winged helix-turn-helix domain-containing protein [Roseovarius faecimaris]QGX97060.1 ArsR family transcriptional regulator [Roseovarius faecimaris]
MKDGPDISRVASLIGDPARANILSALTSGKALTATELAQEAGVTVQTASSHLAKLAEGGLITPRKSGRHKYFSLASEEVAHVLEALMGLAAGAGHLRRRPGPRDPALRQARVCYNHLAGDLGVQLYDSMRARGFLASADDVLTLTGPGAQFVTSLGLDIASLPSPRSPMCRPCLDWSERRTHLAGRLGRGLFAHMVGLGWMTREKNSRVVVLSDSGRAAFHAAFPVS